MTSSESNSKKHLPFSESCFVCGENNTAGLQTRFYVEDDIVKAPLSAQSHHCGYDGIVHGGVAAALLDECMAWAASRAIGLMCYTAELTVRYLKHVPAERTLTACAEVDKSNKRVAYIKGYLIDELGVVYARSKGAFMPMSVDDTLNVDDNLIYQGGEERVFDGLRESAAQRETTTE